MMSLMPDPAPRSAATNAMLAARGLAGDTAPQPLNTQTFAVPSALAATHLRTDSATRNSFLLEVVTRMGVQPQPEEERDARVSIAFRLPPLQKLLWVQRRELRSGWVTATLRDLEAAFARGEHELLEAYEVGNGVTEQAWSAGPNTLVHRALARKTASGADWLARPPIAGNVKGSGLRVLGPGGELLWEVRRGGQAQLLIAADTPVEAVRAVVSGRAKPLPAELLDATRVRRKP